MGTIVGTRGNLVFVDWDDEDEGKMYDSAELRYKLDRDLLRLTPPPKPRRVRVPKEELVCKTCGHKGKKRCGCPRPGAPKPETWGRSGMRQIGITGSFPETLTGDAVDGNMDPSSITDRPKGMMMAEDTEVTEAKGGTLSPKDLAARVGTDAKAFRRFLRSDHSGVVDAGQGNRYSFTEEEAEALLKRYEAWSGNKGERKPRSETEGAKRKRSKSKKDKGDAEEIDFQSAARRRAAEEAEDDLEEIDLDSLDLDLDDIEPSDDEVEEIDDEPTEVLTEDEVASVEDDGEDDDIEEI